MLKQHLSFNLTFFVIFIANIFAESGLVSNLNIFVKPLISISLAMYLVRNVSMRVGFNRLILLGLVLSLFGDFFLIFAGGNIYNFVYGLLAFLLAHILYSMAFFRDFKNNPQASKLFGHIMLFFMGVFSLSYYSWIRDYLNDLRIPIMVYMMVISIMVILAGYRYGRVNKFSFKLIYIGAIFFVMSDSILAYNKFAEPIPFSGVWIMGTYMLAQYLITMGTIERMVLINQIRTQG